MMTLGLPVEVMEVKPDTERLTTKMTQELADLAEEAQPDSQPDYPTEAAHWCYRIPFPGVRYYVYDE
jgi:hypothetical protein